MKKTLTCCLLMLCSIACIAQQKTFTNPLLSSGADPWVIRQGGYYYYTNSTGKNLVIWKTKNMADLGTAE
ncbi:MAG: glycosyl hydrolase family 43, partial [Mucilaginibacter sp.]|nr:glycosyl hydrolase family 43 [Mucilaginibacter sp.]